MQMSNTKKSLKTSNGITLIALVITIIVLLILAGISISMLSGDNGVLQRATDAKIKSDEAQIKERIQLAYYSALTGGKGSYTKDSLMEELKNEFTTDYDVDDSDDKNWKMIAHGQEVIIPAGKIDEEEIDLSVDTTWQNAFVNRYSLNEDNETINIIQMGQPILVENVEIKKYAIIGGIKYDTKLPDICTGLFGGSNAKTITIDSNVDTSNIINMSSMFPSCTNLISVNAPNLVTSSATDLSNMFTDCKSLTNINMSGWNTSNVTKMDYMFQLNQSLTSLDFSGWNTSNVTSMRGIFKGCKSLVNLDLSNWDTSRVTNMIDMFDMISELNPQLQKIIVSNKFIISDGTSSENMFNGCILLVGGSGTTYNSSKIDKTYAHIDGGASNPGYFTAK